MSAKISPAPAIAALRHHGWKYRRMLWDLHHDGHLLVDPNGEERTVQFRGRRQCASRPQYLFGIYHEDFGDFTDMGLWAVQERFVLLIPTSELKEIFDRQWGSTKIDPQARWHVSVYFDRDGCSLLHPTHGDPRDITEYRWAMPE